jgi:hypothetical protein
MSSVGLRARPATGLIDTVIVCLRRRYWDYFVAALIPALPLLVIAVFVSSPTLRWVEWGEVLTSGISAAMTACLVSQEFTGQPVALGEALSRSLRRAPGSVAVELLCYLYILCGLLAVIVGAFLCVAWTYAAIPAFALEEVGVFGALGRSRRLASGLVPHVLGVAIPAVLGANLLYYGAAFAIRAGWAALPDHHYVPARVATLLILLANLAARPIVYVAHAVVYFDLRIRRDGFDIEALAASLDSVSQAERAASLPNAPAADPA